MVPDAVVARADLARPDQLQHLHVARADHDAAAEHRGLIGRTAAGLPWAVLSVLVVSVAVGWVSFQVIEKPTGKLRMLRDRRGGRREYYPELARSGSR